MASQRRICTPLACGFTGLIAFVAVPVHAQCEHQKLTPSDSMEKDAFGRSTDIDGNYLVVGAPALIASPGRPGAAYAYRSEGIDWIELEKLSASDGIAFDSFGTSVAISGDWIVVGAPGAEHQGLKTGAAYVFRAVNSEWNEESKIVPSDVSEFDGFGADVAVEGNYIAVGASGHDQPEIGAGAVYIYWFNGNAWVYQDKLSASDASASTGLGSSLSLFGNVVVARSFVENAAYVFRRNGTAWSEEAKLIPSTLVAADEIADVATQQDEILIGYTQAEPKPWSVASVDNTSGAVFVFRYFAESWIEAGELSPADLTPFARFGHAIEVNASQLVIGAIGSEFTAEGGKGSAYIFERVGFSWVSPTRITASDGSDLDRFGNAVGIEGNYFIVGAPGDDDACPANAGCDSGAAYVFWLKSTPECEPIPTLTAWGGVILVVLLLCAATVRIRGHRNHLSRSAPAVMIICAVWTSGAASAETRPRTPLPKADRVIRPVGPSELQIKFKNALKVRAAPSG